MCKPIEIAYSRLHSIQELLALLQKEGISQEEYGAYVNRYQERMAREKGIPFHGMFELTPLCNLDCKMCYVHLDRDQLGNAEVLTAEQWKSIMRQAHEMGMIHATLTGGECLIYPDFDEIYFFLRSMGIRPNIKTNGLLLDEKRFDFFKRYPPNDVTVSLYGSSNDAYQKVTGHGIFDQIYENLIRLKKADYPVRIAITPSVYMFEDILKIVELSRELGFPFSISIALFPPRKETGRTAIDLSIDQYLKIYQALREGYVDQDRTAEDFEIAEYGENKERRCGLPCGAGRSFFSVNWKGELKGCENLQSLQVSALDQPFSIAWEKIHADAMTYPLPAECSGCAYDNVCFGCVAYRSMGAEPGHCNPKVCERTKHMAKEGFYRL